MAVAHQQRTLQCSGDVLGDCAGAVFQGRRIRQSRLQCFDVSVESGVGTGGHGEFVEQNLDALRASGHGPQRIQRADVARALPDTHQRCLPVEPGHPGVLGISVATQALHRLRGVRGGTFTHPVLRGGQADAAQQCFAFITAVGGIGGAGHPHRDDGGRLGLGGQIGEDVAHQWLVDQVGTEGLSVSGVMNRAGETLTHAGGTAQRAVQAGQVDHLDDGRHTSALLPHQPCDGTVVLHLARGVGMVAELVLQSLQQHSVAGAVGQYPRHQEAAEAIRGVGEHQEHITHGSRGEPLVPGQ